MLRSKKAERVLFALVVVFPLLGMVAVTDKLAATLSDLSPETTNDIIEYRNTKKKEFVDEPKHDEGEQHPRLVRFETTADELPPDYRETAFRLARQRAESRRKEEATLHPSLKDLYGLPPNYTSSQPVKKNKIEAFLEIRAGIDRLNDQPEGGETPFSDNNHTTETPERYVLNLIRVPKAASSALSVTARALAGCEPDGYPCCTNTDRKICPRADLFCDIVKGCIDHQPNYDELANDHLANDDNNNNKHYYPSLSMFREPTSRLLSAFFYHWPHRPIPGRNRSWSVFESDYIPNPRYRNVLTKMLNGRYAYDDFNETLSTTAGAKSRLCRITSFGLTTSPIGLALLLYESGPFRSLKPHPVAFELHANLATGPTSNHTTNLTRIGLDSGASREQRKAYRARRAQQDALRVQRDKVNYPLFKTRLFEPRGGRELVERYNREDFEVYRFAKRLYCARVQEAGLFEATHKEGILHLYHECFDEIPGNSSVITRKEESTADLCKPFESPR